MGCGRAVAPQTDHTCTAQPRKQRVQGKSSERLSGSVVEYQPLIKKRLNDSYQYVKYAEMQCKNDTIGSIMEITDSLQDDQPDNFKNLFLVNNSNRFNEIENYLKNYQQRDADMLKSYASEASVVFKLDGRAQGNSIPEQ